MAGQAIVNNSESQGGKIAGAALGGASKGASMGAAFGPIGMAIGAGIGGIAGGLSQNKKNKDAAAAEQEAKQAQLQQSLNSMEADPNLNPQIQPMKYGSFTRYYDGGMRYMQSGDFSKKSADVKTTFKGQDIPNDKGFGMGPKETTTFRGQKIPATELPGGVQLPIGYGVDKFLGNKHDQAGRGSDSGIILEKGGKGKPGVEVEDGELMAKVKTTKGKKDYIVSDYIVNPATGNTLAEDMEREIKSAKSQKQADQIKQKYVKLNEELKDDGNPDMVKAQEGEYTGGALGAEEAKVGQQRSVGQGKFGEATDESLEAMKARNPWYDFEGEGFDPKNQESVLKFQREYNKRAPEGKKIVEDGKYGTQTDSVKLDPKLKEAKPLSAVTNPELPKELQVREAPSQPGPNWSPGKSTPPEETPVPEETPQEQPAEKGSINLRPTGTMLQALGPAYALTQSMVPDKVAPKYIQAPQLSRVNYDRERAEERGAAAATSEAAGRSMAGPAAFAARQSTAAQSAGRQRAITDAETRANRQIEDQEKAGEMRASTFNAQAYMNADARNAAATNEARRSNMENRIAAVNQLGRIGTQTVKDYNQQRADIFEGQASQVDGEFDRALQNYYKGPKVGLWGKANINPQGGTTMSQQQIDAMYSTQAAEEQPKETARRGRYVKRPGKINRRSRRR